MSTMKISNVHISVLAKGNNTVNMNGTWEYCNGNKIVTYTGLHWERTIMFSRVYIGERIEVRNNEEGKTILITLYIELIYNVLPTTPFAHRFIYS